MKNYNYYVSYLPNGKYVMGTKYNAVSNAVKAGFEYYIITAPNLEEANKRAANYRHETTNYKAMVFEKTGLVDTEYDEGLNCLVCGESGRCPGKHTADEVKKGIERYNLWMKSQHDSEQLNLFAEAANV